MTQGESTGADFGSFTRETKLPQCCVVVVAWTRIRVRPRASSYCLARPIISPNSKKMEARPRKDTHLLKCPHGTLSIVRHGRGRTTWFLNDQLIGQWLCKGGMGQGDVPQSGFPSPTCLSFGAVPGAAGGGALTCTLVVKTGSESRMPPYGRAMAPDA